MFCTRQYFILAIMIAFTATSSVAQDAVRRLPLVEPNVVGISTEHLAHMDPLIEQAIAEEQMPGCVVAIGRRGQLAWRKAYGNRQLQPTIEPMTVDTVFDLASLTKPMATATSVMLLVERGHLRLHDRVVDHIPEFAPNGKDAITVLHLLTHQSGLLPDNALSDYENGSEIAFQRICELPLEAAPGEKFIYSDVGFIVLGELVRRVSDQDLHQFSQENFFRPLGMLETGFLPNAELQARAAPTQQRDEAWIRGEVHDPRAFKMGGVAGHAGLFSTVDDLAVYASMLLGNGTYEGVRVLGPATVNAMTADQSVPSGLRALGWDKQSSYSSNRSELYSTSAFGHGGFTGTVIWIDPDMDLFVIFLSNRVHPDGRGLVNPLAGRIGTIAAAAVEETDSSKH